MHIPDGLQHALQDMYNTAWFQTSKAKISDVRIESATVMRYDGLTHMAEVSIDRAGYTGKGIMMRGAAHYQGATPGTGEAAAHYVGQPVYIAYLNGSGTGMYTDGQILGTRHLPGGNHAPAYAPFAKAGTGTVTVHPNGKGGWGHAKHIDDQSNVSHTSTGKINKEDWGNEHVLGNGSNKPRSQETTENVAGKILGAASKLLGN